MSLAGCPNFCLNLARRPDRKLQAWQQFRREKLEVGRIAAPDAANVMEARGWRNKGARACAAAHRLTWREARRAGAEAVMVFEDDVVLCPGFSAALAALAVPDDWQMLYLGCTFLEVPVPTAPGVVQVIWRTWETHAMLVKSELLSRLHALTGPISRRRHRPEALPMREGDVAIDNLMVVIHREVPVYACYPPLAWQRYGLSNIEDGVRGLWTADGRQQTNMHVTAELDRRMASAGFALPPPNAVTK